MIDLPPWLPVAVWFRSVIVVGGIWLLADVRFRRAHQRRHQTYRSASERMDLFLRDPMRLAREEPTEWDTRARSYWIADQDPEVERLRRRTVGLLGLAIAMVFGGWPVGFLLVAAVQRIDKGYGLLILPQLGILLFWAALLIVAVRRGQGSRSATALLLLAVLISTSLLVISLSLTKQ